MNRISVSAEDVAAQPKLRALVLYFFRLGALGFGGPIALVGYMQRDLVEDKKWVSREDYFEGLAFSQLCPGPLAAQLANYRKLEDFPVQHAVHSLAVDLKTHKVYTPEQEEDGKPVARMVVYEVVSR